MKIAATSMNQQLMATWRAMRLLGAAADVAQQVGEHRCDAQGIEDGQERDRDQDDRLEEEDQHGRKKRQKKLTWQRSRKPLRCQLHARLAPGGTQCMPRTREQQRRDGQVEQVPGDAVGEGSCRSRSGRRSCPTSSRPAPCRTWRHDGRAHALAGSAAGKYSRTMMA
jgi:hypothetical protein